MLVHRMVKKVKDSKIWAKIEDSRGYKVKDSIKSRFNFKKTKDVIPSDEEIGKLVSEVLSQKKDPTTAIAEIHRLISSRYHLSMEERERLVPAINMAVRVYTRNVKDKKTSDKYILVWQNDKYEIYEDENNEYELVRKSNKAVIGQYATLQGAKLDTKDTYEPMNTKNIAAAKALSKARGMAATDKKTKDERIDRKFIASCPACQEMKKYGLSYEETHSSHTPGKLLVEVDGREREIPNPHIVRDSKTKDERIEAGDKLIYSPTMRQVLVTRITKRNANGEAIEVEGKFTEGDVKIIKASELLTKNKDAWTEEARKKALETRRAHAKGKTEQKLSRGKSRNIISTEKHDYIKSVANDPSESPKNRIMAKEWFSVENKIKHLESQEWNPKLDREVMILAKKRDELERGLGWE